MSSVGFSYRSIRLFWLLGGAGLIYTSAKNQTNIGLLRRYLLHRFSGNRFDVPAQIHEKDAIFMWVHDMDKKGQPIVDRQHNCRDKSFGVLLRYYNTTRLIIVFYRVDLRDGTAWAKLIPCVRAFRNKRSEKPKNFSPLDPLSKLGFPSSTRSQVAINATLVFCLQ